MNIKALHTLEYDKIIAKLESYAASPLGKEYCKNLLPTDDEEYILKAQWETSDALTHILTQGEVSFGGVKDIRASLKRLEIGSILGIGELLNISSLLSTAGSVKNFFRKNLNENNETGDSLNERYQLIEPLSPLMKEIRRCIIDENTIADDASVGLSHVRRSMKIAGGKIHDQLNSIVNGSSRSMLQDAIITMRNGRYCLPVKAEYRSSFNGMLHDQSATGSTLFIEPASVVKLNNEIRQLELDEQEEIEKILANLSNQTAEQSFFIEQDFRILSELDFIFAKAMLSKNMKGTRPVFPKEKYIDIKDGRHPLIDPKKVVPINLHLGRDFSLLVVTGPNTGGKTVSLKTVGLFTLMGQAGLHIPAYDHSHLRVYEEVYADIGDEQSIEQSLSTFSSHMTNIVKILEKADDRSLCLFDELCSGTDPTEGAALAISILNRLHQYGAITMATTHYSELKVYALSTDGVENACCEFNVETLSPTYRLLIGIPGKSNAFAISSKLGLDENIIEDAKSRINDNDLDFEDLIASLESQRQTIEKEQLEINSYKAEIEKLKKQLEEKNERIDKSKDKILREANEEAYKILQDAKELADKTIRNFNKYGQGQAPMSQMEKERSALRDKMNDKEKKLSDIKKNTAKANHKAPKKLRIGDSVLVLSLNLKGTVHTLPNAKGDLYVQMGILRSLVNINDLVLLNDDVSPAKKYGGSGSKIKMSKSLSVSSEINLIGKTTDEALALLDKYLDDAYIAHLSSVRIVHGKGTGALRKAVHGLLKRTKTIAEYHLGEFGEGDAGVTIATFK